MKKNIETVKAAYAAFRHGDIAVVMDLLSPDVD
jgi:ketosteroid isomerase-like protein